MSNLGRCDLLKDIKPEANVPIYWFFSNDGEKLFSSKRLFCSLLVRQYQLSLWRESEQFWFVMDTTCNLNQKMSTSQVINEVKVVLKTVIPFKLIVLLQWLTLEDEYNINQITSNVWRGVGASIMFV